jgi:rod shape determining protein RodA
MALYVEEARIGRLHWPLILCVLVIAGLGVWNLGSASRAESIDLWTAQLKALALGTALVGGFMFVDYRVLRSLAWPVYLVTLGMLILVPIKGRVIMGAQRWLEFGPLHIQPSEFAKFAVILMLARYFDDKPTETRTVRKWGLLRTFFDAFQRLWDTGLARYRRALALPPKRMTAGQTTRESGYRILELWAAFVILFVPVVLVIKQPDLGTGLVTTAIGGTMILFAGLTTSTLVSLSTLGGAGAVAAWFFALKPYQKARLTTFLDPMGDAQGKGYHAIQSLIAVGSGPLWGKGWGNGTQNQLAFLPEQHTDFAFPVWAEEHGFVGASIVVVLYLFLVLCALDIAANARDRFGAFLAFGAGALFFWHAFINIGMVTGVLPVVGVPLLLMSYGGSSAVLTLIAIGVLLNVTLRRTSF